MFYPFGFDDNGLPSERLVEKEIGKKAHEIGREEFSKMCYDTTNKYEEEFEKYTPGKQIDVNNGTFEVYKSYKEESLFIIELQERIGI